MDLNMLLILIMVICGIPVVFRLNKYDQDKHIPKRANEEIIKQILAMRCKEPQKRAIESKYLLDGSLSTSERAFPPYTVLHQCDKETGYCSNNWCCSVQNETKIELTYCIEDLITTKKRFKSILVANHTACVCNNQTKIDLDVYSRNNSSL